VRAHPRAILRRLCGVSRLAPFSAAPRPRPLSPADLQFLVLSPGRALLRCDVSLPLAAPARAAVAASARTPAPVLAPTELAAARQYLAVARSLPYAIPAVVRAGIEAALARRRGADRSLGAAEMHRLLCLARLLALSHGEAELSAERWAAALALEAARAARDPPQQQQAQQQQAQQQQVQQQPAAAPAASA